MAPELKSVGSQVITKKDEFFQERRVLPPDYAEQARWRIREAFGLTEEELRAEFKKLRRSYNDPCRTPSKRALMEFIRKRCEAEGIPLYPGDREQDD
jgi:hypothetical protein